MLVFEWEGFGLKSFWKDISLSRLVSFQKNLRPIDRLVSFEAESFPLKYQHPIFEYKIHSVEVDLYYFKYL